MSPLTPSQHEGKGVSELFPTTYTGFTLLEMLIVITILALAAVAVMPVVSTNNQAQVDLATENLATALRFTRSEAIRTGIAHGVIVDHDDSDATGKDIVVYQLDTSGNPFSIDHVSPHPINQVPYDTFLADSPKRNSIIFRNSTPVFTFDVTGASQHVHFDPTGRPVYYSNGQKHRLLSGTIQIGKDSNSRTVTLSSLNGQVTTQ